MKRKEDPVADLREEAARLRAIVETTTDVEARRQLGLLIEELERRAAALERPTPDLDGRDRLH